MDIQFLGAAGEVTGSCYLLRVGDKRLLLDCGMIQGSRQDEARNREPFPFDPHAIDAVVLSHAHIDHSGRIPLLVRSGYKGPIYTQHACKDLCRIMLKDSGFLNEKEAEWENRKRERKGLELFEPLYTMQDAELALHQFRGVAYETRKKILPGVTVRLRDAGHILGASIVELELAEGGERRTLVFSGDLGHKGAPILRDPTPCSKADLVIMESTYGDRLHRSWDDTEAEIKEVLAHALRAGGNILIPAFAVGRSQDLLYLFGKYSQELGLDRWQIFLDSPMAIQATAVYIRHSNLYDREAAELWRKNRRQPLLPNLHFLRTANQSMGLNRIRSGAIIIAGSGMCTGGRIKHHLKHNLWRDECHIMIVGYQAEGTLGRALVDGARYVRLWGETVRVGAQVHTIGGLSAHADQAGLMSWYDQFDGRPTLMLVHGETDAVATLSQRLTTEWNAPVHAATKGMRFDLLAMRHTTP